MIRFLMVSLLALSLAYPGMSFNPNADLNTSRVHDMRHHTRMI